MTVKPFCRPLLGPLAVLAAYAALRMPVMAQTGYPLVQERDVLVPLPMFQRLSFKWSGHYLLDVNDDLTSAPVVVILRGEHDVERISFDIPGASVISVRDYAAAPDGTVVLCGSAGGAGPKAATFLSVISADRKGRVVTQLWPFVPERVAIAGDRTIWAAGYMHEESGLGVLEGAIMQRFDRSGKLLASFAPRARPVPHYEIFLSRLLASGDRVGWFTPANQYIEYSLTGQELNRYDGPLGVRSPNDVCGVGLGGANQLSVCVRQEDSVRVLTLNPSTRGWDRALPDERRFVLLLGYDGSTLVTSSATTGEAWTLRQYVPKDAVRSPAR